ncbi:MAG: hypothetical protein KDA90_21390 [Planctomycetaceae bacterium]|nr:hypothetical protein [Planctomycetaceae bacterium]
MPRRTIDHQQTFALEDGWLVRTVIKPNGSSYQHRCSLAAYRAVTDYIDEHTNEGVTTNGLWDGLPDVPCTQAAIALAFLKELGCVTVCHRRCYPVSKFLVEDALIEFHALNL